MSTMHRPIMRRSGAELMLEAWPLFQGNHDEVLDEIAECLAARVPALVVTPNTAHIRLLEHDQTLRHAYSKASLLLVDSMPLAWLARALNSPVHRLTGADMLPLISSVAAERGWKIAILGGPHGAAKRAADVLRERHPYASIVGVDFPMTASIPDPADLDVIAELNRQQADIVFVCLGAPKQEAWVLHWMESLPPAVYLGTGAAVDFVTGDKKRAPKWLQAVGAEWLWRLAQEPRRLFARYVAAGAAFVRLVARSMVSHTGGGAGGA